MPNSNNPKSTASCSVAAESQSKDQAWQPGLRQTPWFAMILIIIMLLCMGACAGIIAGSDGRAVDSWKVSPAVLLALISSIWNYSIGTVLGVSVTITWWRSALRGTTLESLHYIWNQGTGLNPISALRSSATARKVVLLAWVVVLVQIGSGPLLQRSTRTDAENVVVDDTLTLYMARILPDGWLGSIQDASTATIIGSRNGLSTIQEWWRNSTISTFSSNNTGSQCFGTCDGTIQGTGMNYECTSTTFPLDLSSKENEGTSIFAINTTLSTDSGGAPMLLLTTLFSSEVDSSCVATINLTTCNIGAAVVEYPIVVENATVMLNMEKLSSPTVVSTYTSAGDLPTAPKGQGAGPLEGLNDFFGQSEGSYLFENATMLIDPTRNITLYTGGLMTDLFFLPDASSYNASIFHKCGLKWSSPTEYVLDSMHDFLFRASFNASTDADSQTFSVQRTNLGLIFRSNYSYLAAALSIMLFAFLAVLFQLWGWWELGRQVSFSPLELARAFRAPSMPLGSETAGIGGLLKIWGKARVQYTGEGFDMNGMTSNNSEDTRVNESD